MFSKKRAPARETREVKARRLFISKKNGMQDDAHHNQSQCVCDQAPHVTITRQMVRFTDPKEGRGVVWGPFRQLLHNAGICIWIDWVITCWHLDRLPEWDYPAGWPGIEDAIPHMIGHTTAVHRQSVAFDFTSCCCA